MRDCLKEFFPELTEPELIDEIEANGILQDVESGQKLMDFGREINYIPLLVDGSIKIMRQDNKGNELFLYYLTSGETCAITLNRLFPTQKSQIAASTEENSKLILVPVQFMDIWMNKYPSWKKFVMDTYMSRMDELLNAIDSIAFYNMDERLWKYLLDKSTALNSHTLSVTHKEIAYELNSTREVISRLLKQLEKQGKIKLGRNRIEIVI